MYYLDLVCYKKGIEMKKNVAIVTIIAQNYGNRLQNFALQKYLQNMGVNVSTIPYNKGDFGIKWNAKYIVNEYILRKKNQAWNRFNKMINWEKNTIGKGNSKLCKKYDYFISGSDQVWNPLFDFNSEREYLTFAKPNQKISYAASIGISYIPDDFKSNFETRLKDFAFISVRERDAAKLVKDIAKRDCTVVLDPTMLLSKDEWRIIAKDAKYKISSPYIIKYFLGKRTKEYEAFIEEKAKKLNAIIIDVLDESGELNMEIGPTEFLNLFLNSEAVFTDSFHGAVFSILFQKPFVVFQRPYQEGFGKMSSRLDTLLQLTGLEEQRVSTIDDIKKINLNCKYDKANEQIEKERIIAKQFLMSALSISE